MPPRRRPANGVGPAQSLVIHGAAHGPPRALPGTWTALRDRSFGAEKVSPRGRIIAAAASGKPENSPDATAQIIASPAIPASPVASVSTGIPIMSALICM